MFYLPIEQATKGPMGFLKLTIRHDRRGIRAAKVSALPSLGEYVKLRYARHRKARRVFAGVPPRAAKRLLGGAIAA